MVWTGLLFCWDYDSESDSFAVVSWFLVRLVWCDGWFQAGLFGDVMVELHGGPVGPFVVAGEEQPMAAAAAAGCTLGATNNYCRCMQVSPSGTPDTLGEPTPIQTAPPCCLALITAGRTGETNVFLCHALHLASVQPLTRSPPR